MKASINMKENGHRSYDVEVYNFYSPLQTRDDTNRTQFLDTLDKTLKDLVDVNEARDNEENGRYTLKNHLPVVLRLSYDIPFPDVREQCARILQELEVGRPVYKMFVYSCVAAERIRTAQNFKSNLSSNLSTGLLKN